MATDTLCTSLLDWDPIAGYLPPIAQEPQERLVPECIDAVMAEWNPRVAEQLAKIGPQFQETFDVHSRPANYKLNGHVHSPLGFTLLPSVHDRYNTRIGQR